jgi:hypothetical protein
MKKLAQLWITLCLALPGLIAHGDTTLVANINGYSLDADRELIQFTAIQFSDCRRLKIAGLRGRLKIE